MKAFISSAVTVLAEYRQVVQDVLRDLGVDYVTLDGILARDSPPEAVSDRVLHELKRSDLVVLIIGHRYGSVEPRSGMGWVEAEFQAARRLSIPILAFLAHDQGPQRV